MLQGIWGDCASDNLASFLSGYDISADVIKHQILQIREHILLADDDNSLHTHFRIAHVNGKTLLADSAVTPAAVIYIPVEFAIFGADLLLQSFPYCGAVIKGDRD